VRLSKELSEEAELKPFIIAAIGVFFAATAGIAVWAVWPRESPDYAWDEMRAAACAGNIDDFYSRLDWTSVSNAIAKRVSQGNVLAKIVSDVTLEKVRKEWDDDIRLGAAGTWCQAKKTDSDPETGVIYWSTPSGKGKRGEYSLSGGKYILVDLDNTE